MRGNTKNKTSKSGMKEARIGERDGNRMPERELKMLKCRPIFRIKRTAVIPAKTTENIMAAAVKPLNGRNKTADHKEIKKGDWMKRRIGELVGFEGFIPFLPLSCRVYRKVLTAG